MSKDLFGNETLPAGDGVKVARFHRPKTNPRARGSSLPGKPGDTCATCIHAKKKHLRSGRGFYKCAVAFLKPTNGGGTDIRLKDPSCARHEKKV